MNGSNKWNDGKQPHHNKTPSNKPHNNHGISQSPDLTRQIIELKKRVSSLETSLGESNQWNNKVRQWIDKSILIELTTRDKVIGTLKGLDRYTLFIDGVHIGFEKTHYLSMQHNKKEIIVHKGSIATIELFSLDSNGITP
jgi:hypothetical protein